MSAKGFLDLPGNVRRRIYRLLYTLDGCLFPLESTKDLIAGISLLRCCHQLCIEGCKILYGSNKIVLDPRSMHYAWFFLVIIGENNCRFLRHLCIDAIPCQYEADLVFGGMCRCLHPYVSKSFARANVIPGRRGNGSGDDLATSVRCIA